MIMNRKFFLTIFATAKKNRIINKKIYPISIVMQRLINIIGTFLFPLFIYLFVFNTDLSPSFFESTDTKDYVTYLTLGQSFMIIIMATLMNVGRSLILEFRQGTLMNLIYSSSSSFSYLIGVFIEQFKRTIIESLVILFLGISFGASVATNDIIMLLIFIFLSSFVSFSMSILVAAFMLSTKDTFIIQNTLLVIISLVCGVTFPVDFLPNCIQVISYSLPWTYLLNAYRNCVLLGQPLSQNLESIMLSILISLIYLCVGKKYLRNVQKRTLEVI